jgi:hypothetical protein
LLLLFLFVLKKTLIQVKNLGSIISLSPFSFTLSEVPPPACYNRMYRLRALYNDENTAGRSYLKIILDGYEFNLGTLAAGDGPMAEGFSSTNSIPAASINNTVNSAIVKFVSTAGWDNHASVYRIILEAIDVYSDGCVLPAATPSPSSSPSATPSASTSASLSATPSSTPSLEQPQCDAVGFALHLLLEQPQRDAVRFALYLLLEQPQRDSGTVNLSIAFIVAIGSGVSIACSLGISISIDASPRLWRRFLAKDRRRGCCRCCGCSYRGCHRGEGG